jgi:uncharacterized YccA/Bax inhibitor family protein
MGFKLVLNVLYTMGVALCFIVAYKMAVSVPHNYPVMAGAIIVGVIVIFMKLRLLKEVKDTQGAPQNKKK